MAVAVTDRPARGRSNAWDSALLAAGLTAPVVRLADVVILGALASGYSQISDAISELGAVGSDTELAHRLATTLVAALQALLAVGLWKRSHRLLAVVVAVSAIGYLGSALFAPSQGLPLPGERGFELRDALHAAFGVPTGIALVAAPLAGLRLRLGVRFRAATAGAAVFAVVLGTLSLALAGASTRGLWQRAFNVPAFAWQAYLALTLLRRNDQGHPDLTGALDG